MSQNSPQKWFNLEELFFSEVDQALINKLRGEMHNTETAEAIMNVSGINDEGLAGAMAKLNISIDTLSAFRLAPLVEVAWADDRVEENERYAITKAAEKAGISPDSPDMELLKSWTNRRPQEELFTAWCDYAKALSQSLTEVHRRKLKKEMMAQIRSVAQASGGVLGFGSISASEKAVIDRIEKILS